MALALVALVFYSLKQQQRFHPDTQLLAAMGPPGNSSCEHRRQSSHMSRLRSTEQDAHTAPSPHPRSSEPCSSHLPSRAFQQPERQHHNINCPGEELLKAALQPCPHASGGSNSILSACHHLLKQARPMFELGREV